MIALPTWYEMEVYRYVGAEISWMLTAWLSGCKMGVDRFNSEIQHDYWPLIQWDIKWKLIALPKAYSILKSCIGDENSRRPTWRSRFKKCSLRESFLCNLAGDSAYIIIRVNKIQLSWGFFISRFFSVIYHLNNGNKNLISLVKK